MSRARCRSRLGLSSHTGSLEREFFLRAFVSSRMKLSGRARWTHRKRGTSIIKKILRNPTRRSDHCQLSRHLRLHPITSDQSRARWTNLFRVCQANKQFGNLRRWTRPPSCLHNQRRNLVQSRTTVWKDGCRQSHSFRRRIRRNIMNLTNQSRSRRMTWKIRKKTRAKVNDWKTGCHQSHRLRIWHRRSIRVRSQDSQPWRITWNPRKNRKKTNVCKVG
mmetsp:Transcript_16154/g.43920  ORF Transcript_16154/g.43920 Transcript_16154/m.43920 type:complete len:219 (+) Transcript_16154:33-689(+)